jgi:glutaminyl-peptide cyclotransferase
MARGGCHVRVLERRLHKLGLLSSHPREVSYFRKDINLGPVEDDHVPFLQQGERAHPHR